MEPARPLDLATVEELIPARGMIQPHGILAVVAADTQTIECISDNVGQLLGVEALDLCGSPLNRLFAGSDAKAFAAKLRAPQATARNPVNTTLAGRGGEVLPVECSIARSGERRWILEFEPAPAGPESASFIEAEAPVERLATAPDLDALLTGAAADLRALCGFDRTVIYRFHRDGRIDVAARGERPGTAAPDIAIPEVLTPAARRFHLRNALRIVADTGCEPARLIARDARAAPGPAELARTTLGSSPADAHDVFLAAGGRAALTISIVVGGQLWGLAAAYHAEPRRLGYRKRAMCEFFVHMLAWQIDARLERRRDETRARDAALLATMPAAAGADLPIEERGGQAAALIKLHEDVAAALPSRAAVASIISEFARRQTRAGGSSIETLGDNEIACESASGLLAPLTGTREPRAGTLSSASADLDSPLLCDTVHDLEPAERSLCARLGVASLIVVPVVISDAETIVIKVASAQPGAFGDADIQTLKLAASNLRTAARAAHEFTALAQAEREQRAYARRLRALHAIASTTRSNRKDQIDAALHLGLEQLDLDWAFLGVIDYATQEFVIENSVSRNGPHIVEAGVRTALGATVAGRIAHSKGVRIVQDVSKSKERPAFGGWTSYIAAPLFIAGVNYGTIGFTSRDVRTQPFSEANIEFIAVAGELISSAVERGLQREQLEKSETRYRALTEAIPEMVWVIDLAGQFEYVNARWSHYTGLSLEQSRAQGCENFYDPDGFGLLNAGRHASPAAEYECEVRLRRHDGTYRWHLVRSVPFPDSAGDAEKWLVTATDIEERKSAETVMASVHDAALAATQAKSRFLATMSHEIRTPMNAVIGMTELLLLTQLSEEQREYIEIVRDSGQSLLRVLNDILDYSKIEAGKLELETVHFDLPAQIESVVELLRAQYQIKGVELTTSIGADIPSVVAGDPGRLRQILLNLAGNALKFTAPGGRVHIGVTAASKRARGDALPIRFTVKDTGIGISREIVAKLFVPFSQGDESTTRKYGGTGLGLSICAQLVSLMNGTIGVHSVPGEGSAFWFEIPLRGAKNSAKSPDNRKRAAARAKPVIMRAEKILLVEDNEINTFLALKQLQRIGFIVSAVNNGQQAVDAVTREHFDLVFMDCHMPEMDGFAATREIRRLEAGGTRHLPIVAMTADARDEDHQNCLRAGMDDYVSKPTSLESLRAVLHRWLPSPDRRQNSRTTTARAAPAPTLRVAKLLDLFGGDRNAVITLLTAAAGSIKADFARIENCLAAGDRQGVAEAAHRLKGTSASIRSPRLGELSNAVERAAGAGEIPAALIAQLRGAVDALSADVERHSKVLTTIG